MLLLLSSGARARYREDIVRCLALPSGGHLQFRYDLTIVDDTIVNDTASGKLVGQSALVCYLWNRTEGAPTEFIPCRMVEIVRAEIVGSSFIVLFEVGPYPKFDDEVRFATLIPDDLQRLPRWERDGAAFKLCGLFAVALGSKPIFNTSSELNAFEGVVKKLSRFTDFSADKPSQFFAVIGVRNVKLDFDGNEIYEKIASSRHGSYDLNSGDEYELLIYVFAPDRGPIAEISETAIHVQSENKLIEFPLTKSREIDSEYDLKRFRFFTEKSLWRITAALIVFTHSKHAVDEGSCDIAVPVVFKGRWMEGAIRTGLIAFGSSVPAMLAAAASSKLGIGLGLLMFGAAMATGIGTVFFASRKT
jgi:hypothetical protein